MRRLVLATLLVLGLASAPQAGTVAYRIDAANSTVAFETDFGPDLITGSFPLEKADLGLDFANVANCTIDVALDVTGAKASMLAAFKREMEGDGTLTRMIRGKA